MFGRDGIPRSPAEQPAPGGPASHPDRHPHHSVGPADGNRPAALRPRGPAPSKVIVLAAHVDTRRDGLGPFARLRKVRTGAEIQLATGDGPPLRYRVSEVRTIDKATVPLDQVFQREGPATLVLVTCGGQYDRGVGYSDNVIVTAVPEPR